MKMYNGTPIATCVENGVYMNQGGCRIECGPPPVASDASPIIDNAVVVAGWIEGMSVRYACNPGFEGSVIALCENDGNYTLTGFCTKSSSAKTGSLYQKIYGLSAVIGVENVVLAAIVVIICWRKRYASAHSQSLLSRTATQEMTENQSASYAIDASPNTEQFVSTQ